MEIRAVGIAPRNPGVGLGKVGRCMYPGITDVEFLEIRAMSMDPRNSDVELLEIRDAYGSERLRC